MIDDLKVLHFFQRGCEVAPVSWAPDHLCFRSSRCQRSNCLTLRNSGNGWSSWFEPDARQSSLLGSLSLRQAIRNWIAQVDRDEGRREDGLTTAERAELNRLRRENKQLKLERDILSKAAAWFARQTNAIPPKGSAS